MKVIPEKETYRLNRFLARFLPIIADRSTLRIKLRLLLNYLLESLVLIAVMLSVCIDYRFDAEYLVYILLSLRFCFYLLSFKMNIIDAAIALKVLIIISAFSKFRSNIVTFQIVLLIIHILFAAILSLSCEQRRGEFDERLGVIIPFCKQVIIVVCAFLIHSAASQFRNIYYPTVVFAILHTLLCHMDNIYNFHVKNIIIGISMLSLAVTSILSVLYLTSLNSNSIMMVGVLSYFILLGWILNLRQFEDFKIIEENPNSFAEWDYKQYFQKLIYLMKESSQQQNQEILRGFYKYHEHICFSAECPIRYCHQLEKERKQKQSNYEQDLQTICRYINSYLKNQLQIATIKFPNLKRFYIFYISPSVQALRYCDKDNFIQFREAQRIQIMFQSKDIQFQKQSNEMVQKEIQQYIELYIQISNSLWRLLYDDNIDFARFEKLGVELLVLKSKIVEYQKYPILDNNSLKLIKDFKDYLLDEKVDNYRMIQEQTESKLYNFIQIHTKEHPILIISAESETLQRIQNVNASLCRLVGYSKKQMIEKKLNDILPEFIGNFHTKLLTQRSKQLLYQKQKKLQTLVYIVTRSGYVFEAALHILQLNSIKGRKWSCIVNPTNQTNILIVTNGQGQIQAITSNAYNIGLDLNSLGKKLCPDLEEELVNNFREWRTIGNSIDHLFDREEDSQKLQQFNANIRMKANVGLTNPSRFWVFQIDIKKNEEKPASYRPHQIRGEQQAISRQEWKFNYPNVYSNVDYHTPVDIKIKQEEHYQFVDFGEGINQMRYINGQIQYKQDKSESSFQKQETQNSLVQIIDFSMKKQTYLQVINLNKNKYPKPLIEFSAWMVAVVILIIGMTVASFLIFYLNTHKHNTYAAVLAQLDILKYQYSSIAHSSIELAYISQSVWSNTSQMTISNITSKLQTIANLSPLLNQNQSYINTFTLNHQVTPTITFYDMISEFKLQANSILNNPSNIYNFSKGSPVYQIMNISVNYMDEGFKTLSSTLLTDYQNSISSYFNIYALLFVGLVVAVCLISIRIYIIIHRMNKQKVKLLSIYLEIEESVIQKVLQRNNSFKAMLKYNKTLNNEEEEIEENFNAEGEEERSAKKRVKAISKFNYFYYFVLWGILYLGIYSVNSSIQVAYINTLNSDLQQIVNFGEAHLIQQNTYTTLNYLTTTSDTLINGSGLIQYGKKKVTQIYNTQMKFRESLLITLNKKLFSDTFSSFFLAIWVNNACKYLTYPKCMTDYHGIFQQGGDQYWSFYVRKLDEGISKMASQSFPLPSNYYLTFGGYPDVLGIRNATKFYSQDFLTIPHMQLMSEISYQIQKASRNKTYLFGAVIGLSLMGLVFYFGYCLKRMKESLQQIEEILGLIPFKKLSTIISFKKYIRKKYEQQGY